MAVGMEEVYSSQSSKNSCGEIFIVQFIKHENTNIVKEKAPL
jgi:hypothetical protein